MTTTFRYKGHTVEIVPTPSGFYCKWDGGETHLMETESAALFLAEQMIDSPELYELPKEADWPVFREG
jgi:hypothetical protein